VLVESSLALIRRVDALVSVDCTVNKFRQFEKTHLYKSFFPDRVSSLLLKYDHLVGKKQSDRFKICRDFLMICIRLIHMPAIGLENLLI